jgi:hypothetical protein
MKALERVATRPALHVSRLFAVVVAIWLGARRYVTARRSMHWDPNRTSRDLGTLNWTVILLYTSSACRMLLTSPLL